MVTEMTKDDFINEYLLEDGTVILEDWDTFHKGIIGVTDDHCHIIYGYNKLTEALADSYMQTESINQEEAMLMAIDWIEYNTIRAIPYMDKEYRPIIAIEVDI